MKISTFEQNLDLKPNTLKTGFKKIITDKISPSVLERLKLIQPKNSGDLITK